MLRQLKSVRCMASLLHPIRRDFSDSVFQSGFDSAAIKGDVGPAPTYRVPQAKYGGITFVTLLTGQTIIGKQGASYMKGLLHSARVPVGMHQISDEQEADYFNSVLRNHAAVHIDIIHDAAEKRKALKICNDLDLYMFMTRIRTFPGFNCRFPDVDIQLITQNNMGNYLELEYSPVRGVVEALRVVTEQGIDRVLRFAFEATRRAKRKRMTLVHLRDEWPVTDGVMVDAALQLQRCEYTDIEVEPLDLGECVGRLILSPGCFDVLVTNDRYATFMATICSAVCGGATLFSAVEIGDEHAVFKPLQTKLSLTNYQFLSPYGIISTCVDLLYHLGHSACAEAMWTEMLRTMKDGVKTVEFGGRDTGEYVVCNLVNRLRCKRFGDKSTAEANNN